MRKFDNEKETSSHFRLKVYILLANLRFTLRMQMRISICRSQILMRGGRIVVLVCLFSLMYNIYCLRVRYLNTYKMLCTRALKCVQNKSTKQILAKPCSPTFKFLSMVYLLYLYITILRVGNWHKHKYIAAVERQINV